MGVYACKKNDSIDTSIVNLSGKWLQEGKWSDNFMFQEIYHFKTNQTFEITRSVIDSGTKEIKGYVTKTTGTFDFKGDSLILADSKFYSVKSHTYKNLAELEYITTYKRQSYKTVYTHRDTLILRFLCPINANCVPYPKMTRLKQ